MSAFDKVWGLMKEDARQVKCPTCKEMVHPDDIGGQIVDYDHWEKTGEGEIRMIDSKNPEQCRYCEWGPEA